MMPNSISAVPKQVENTKVFDFNLEALRGFAAMVVVWHHFIYHQNRLDPHYTPTGIAAFNPPGHVSVLVFFVLSGYVIGRVHYSPLTRQEILPYLKKRFVRIYPIYLITMLIGLLIAWGDYPATTIAGNLTMMQDFLTPVIFENNPAWSLNYEVLFYLLFIPLSYFRVNISFATLFFAIFGIVKNVRNHHLLGGYALGFAFWLCGVLLARYCQRSRTPSFSTMVCMLLMLLSVERFSTLWVLLNKVAYATLNNAHAIDEGAIQVVDFAYLPYCVVMVLIFTSKKFPYRKYIISSLLLIPAFTFYDIASNFNAAQDKPLVIPGILYMLAIVIYLARKRLDELCKRFIQYLSGSGAWSYGLYMIHFPIISVFYRVEWFSGSALTFSIRLICYIAACYGAAYLLEKKIQPWIKALFYRGERVAVARNPQTELHSSTR